MLFIHPVRWFFKLLALVIVAIVAYFAVTLVQVWLTSRQYDPRPAGAIVVMGAAQYYRVPSPDLRARLDGALKLFHQGYSHVIMVTGGKQPGDRFTEAEAGAYYLEHMGVPAQDILEAGGNDSWQNLSDAAPTLKAHGATVVLMVSDPFHEHRSLAVATDVGLTAYPTPTQTSPIRGLEVVPYFLKETLGVGLGRIIGYQNLHALG